MKPWHRLTSLPVQQVNRKALGKTCGDCDNFLPCPNPTCHWGLCRAELERWDGGNLDAFVCEGSEADECEDFEEGTDHD